MRKKEQLLWDNMRANLGHRAWLERVENLMAVGRPDVDVLIMGTHSCVELKSAHKWPARKTSKVLGSAGCNQDQKNWHLEYQRNHGRSYILVGVGSGSSRELFLVGGHLADFVNDYNREELEKFRVTWDEIYEILSGRSFL